MNRASRLVWIGIGLLILLSSAGLLRATLPHITFGTWTSAGSLSQARSNATSMLLSNGSILIVGGDGGNGALQSAEIFGTDGSVSSAAAMNVARSRHFAVLLSDGRVLVGGGITSSGGTTNTAEIYDASANAWTPVGVMTLARANATAAVLSDGRVVIAGGDNAGAPSNTIEIFDPSSGSFSFAGSMSASRTQHAMAVLHDGRVLIVGGFDGTNPLSSSDIYDPSSGNLSAGPSLVTPRYAHSATNLLNGNVAIMGGASVGANGPMDLASIEIFDSASGTFSTASASLTTARQGHQAFLLPNNNAVLIVGGTSGGAAQSSTELLTPQISTSDGTWSYAVSASGAMMSPRAGLTGSVDQANGPTSVVTPKQGYLIVGGGNDANGTTLASTEAYGYATVQTDQGDYPPGTNVNITGSGFKPSESVSITLVEFPLIDTHGPYTVTADANGNISDSSFTTDSHDLNVHFFLSVVGSQSGLVAQNTFTDSKPNTVTVGTQQTNPVAPGGSTQYTVTVGFNGNNQSCTANLSVTTALPTGAASSFSPSSVTSTGVDQTSTLTITTTSATPPGSSNFTVQAAGTGTACNGNNAAGNGTLVVVENTTTTLVSSLPTSTFGQSITLTATVAKVTGPTTPIGGTVTFLDGGTQIGTATLSSGTATLPISTLAAGSHSLTAFYGGVTNSFGASTSSAITQTVNQASTTTTVSNASGTAGQGSVTLNANVTANSPSTATVNEGTVTFTVKQGTTTIGTVTSGTVSGGTASASFSLATVSAGTYSINATYNPAASNPNFTTSTAATLGTLTVNATSTTATVTSSTNPSVFGQSITFTAKIAPASGTSTPTGTVQFVVDGSNLGAPVNVAACAPIPDACATSISTSTLSVGSHSVVANYSGDGNYSTSSSTLTQTVTKAATSTALASSANPSVLGQSVTFTATVTVSGPGTGTVADGVTVTFKDGATTLGTGTTTAGVASFATSALSVATHSVTAAFGGDGDFAISTSNTVSQVVNKAATTTSITSDLSTATIVGQAYTVSASVAITAPGAGTIPNTDTVTVSDGTASCTMTLSSAAGSCSLTSNIAGAKTITATYNGDGNFSTSTSAGVAHTVNKANTTTAISSNTPNPSTVGQTVTINYSVSVNAPGSGTPTGNVTVSDGVGDSCTASVAAASCQITFNTAGIKTLTATYAGDGNFDISTSPTANQTVNPKVAITSTAFTTVTGVCSPQITAQTQNNDGTGANGARTLNLSGPATGKFYGDNACTNQITTVNIPANASTANFFYSDTAQGNSTISVSLTGLTPATQTEAFTGLRFGTNAFTAALNQCSPAFTIQSGPTTGNPVSVTQNATVSLSSSSANGKFYSDAGCTAQITSALIGPGIDGGHDTPSIFYKDGSAGGPTLTGSAGSASATQTETISKLTPTFSVPASQSITFGTASITLSGTLAAGSNFPPNGETINITINGVTTPATIGTTGTFSASIDTHAIPASATAYTITYNYAGDNNFNAATNTATTLTVNKGTTSTSLASSQNPSFSSQPATFTATVSLTNGSGVPTGTVQFKEGGGNLGSAVALTNNGGVFTATFQTSSLSVGTHNITAVYSGDNNFGGSTSNTISQVVNNPATTTTVSSSLNPSTFGQSVAFGVTVTSQAGTPTGSVIFYDGACGGTALSGAIPLDGSGKASFSTAALSAGSHTIFACYTPTGNFLASSGSVSQSVNKATPTVTFTGAPANATFGQQFTVSATTNASTTATITASGACTISGTTVTMASGLGICNLQAGWDADTNYVSATLTQSTNALPAPASVTVVDRTITYDGTPQSVTPTVSPAVAYTVTYTGISPTVYATSTTAPTEPGSYTVVGTVTDPNYTGSGSGTLTISKKDPALVLALLTGMPEPSAYGTRVYFELTTANSPCPTGQVDFYVDSDSTSSKTVTLSDSPCTTQPIEFGSATLIPGNHTVYAVYSGDAHYLNQNSAVVAHQVNADQTTVTLASSATSLFVGDPVTFTATVTPVTVLDGSAATPSGSVQFYDNTTTLLDTKPVVANGSTFSAVLTINSLAAGSHSVTATFVSSSGNFGGSSSPVSLETVDKITPTITWASPADIVYGTKLGDAQLNATATDAHNGNVVVSGKFAYNPAKETLLAVGTRNLSVTFTPDDTNTYSSQTATATINVNPATLTITADDATRAFGADNPTFTFRYSGFVNNEDPAAVTTSPTCTTTATSSSNVGTYPITCSGGAATNYTFSYVGGTLHVTPATLTASIAGDPTKPYDGNNTATLGAGNYSLNGVVGTDSITVTKTSGTYNSADVATANTVTVSLAGTDFTAGAGTLLTNYTLPTSASGPGHITKADAHITVTPYNLTYNGDPHTATGTAIGVKNEGLTGLDLSATSHTDAGTYSDTWNFTDVTGNYNNATGTVTDVIAKADPVITAVGGTFTYDGSPHAGSATATGVKGESLSPVNIAYTDGSHNVLTSAPVNAGTYSIAARFAGNNNYNQKQSAAVPLVINKADAHISVTPYSVTYDGNPHTATGNATGVESTPADLTSLLHLSGTTHTNAGDYPNDAWTFEGNGNYNSTTGTVHDHIDKADPAISVTGYNVTYDGDPHTAAGTAKGIKGEALSGLDLSATNHTNAGTYADTWNFTDVTGNYNNATSTVTDVIAKADPVITAVGGTFTYDGNPHAGSATATGVKGENLTPVNVAYKDAGGNLLMAAPVNAGTYSVAARFAGDANYNPKQSAAATLTINKADAVVSVTPYSVTYDGNPHTATGTAKGVESPTPSDLSNLLDLSGTMHTNAGNYSDTWSFAGNSNYNSASGTVSDAIAKADPVLTATGGTFTYDGNPHAGSGTATGVKGENLTLVNVAYKDGGGNLLTSAPVNAGTYSVAARYAGDSNYNPKQSAAATLIINKADAVVSVTPYSVTYDGNPHTATSTIIGMNGESGATVGTVTLNTTHTNAGTYSIDSWSFTGTANYSNIGTTTITDSIGKANATVVVTPYTNIPYDGHAHTAAVTSITGVNGETGATVGTVDVSHTTHTPAGTYASDYWSFAGIANYNDIGNTAITDSIGKANAAVVVTPYTSTATTYTGLPHAASITSITGVNGETGATVGTVNVSNTSHTSAGTYASDYWFFTGTANYNDIGNTTITDSIARSNATIVVAPYTVMYDGNAHTATVNSITGVNGESGTTVGTVTLNTTHTNAGSYPTDTWSFTGSANYNDMAATTITDTINKANATINVTAYNVTYDGNPHTATGTAIGVKGETLAGLDLSKTTHSSPANYTDTWTFTDSTGNYNNVPAGAPAPTTNDVIHFATGGICNNGAASHVILQPINADGTSVFKMGSTVPTKFAICDAFGNSVGPTAAFANVVKSYSIAAVKAGTITQVDEAVTSTTPDTAFRWDPTAQQWIFNTKTGSGTSLNNTNATYLFQIVLIDGTVITGTNSFGMPGYQIGLK